MAAFLLVRGAVLDDRTPQPNRSSNPPVVIAEQVRCISILGRATFPKAQARSLTDIWALLGHVFDVRDSFASFREGLPPN
jgi:hypothetical protein